MPQFLFRHKMKKDHLKLHKFSSTLTTGIIVIMLSVVKITALSIHHQVTSQVDCHLSTVLKSSILQTKLQCLYTEKKLLKSTHCVSAGIHVQNPVT